jgi:hypothetical protein
MSDMKIPPGRVTPWHQTNWDWRAAGNFIGGGTGTGTAVLRPGGRQRSNSIMALVAWPHRRRPDLRLAGDRQALRAINVFFHRRPRG